MTWNYLVNIILIIYIIVLGCELMLYAPRMRAWVSAFHKEKHLVNDKKNKIAVIIPARNESKVIGELFDSLEKQTYDHKYFDVHVIVKEDTDPTIEMSKNLGYKVHIIRNQTCKGDAMEETFNEILAKDQYAYDQYLFLDADCILDDKFIEECNNAVASGRDVITTKKIVKNYWFGDFKKNNTWASCCNGLIWPLLDDCGNKYKSENNIVQFPVGTGLMISAKVIREIGGWPYRETITEDAEFALDAILRGYTCYYTGFAKIYTEEATSLSMTNKRRSRWLGGVIETYRIYGDRLREYAHRKQDVTVNRSVYYGLNLNIVYTFIGTLLSLILLSGVGSIFFAIIGHKMWITSLITFGASLLTLYICFMIPGMLAVIVDRKNIKLNWFKKVLLVLSYPIFFAPYVIIITKGLLSRKTKKWDVIERTANFSTDSKNK